MKFFTAITFFALLAAVSAAGPTVIRNMEPAPMTGGSTPPDTTQPETTDMESPEPETTEPEVCISAKCVCANMDTTTLLTPDYLEDVDAESCADAEDDIFCFTSAEIEDMIDGDNDDAVYEEVCPDV